MKREFSFGLLLIAVLLAPVISCSQAMGWEIVDDSLNHRIESFGSISVWDTSLNSPSSNSISQSSDAILIKIVPLPDFGFEYAMHLVESHSEYQITVRFETEEPAWFGVIIPYTFSNSLTNPRVESFMNFINRIHELIHIPVEDVELAQTLWTQLSLQSIVSNISESKSDFSTPQSQRVNIRGADWIHFSPMSLLPPRADESPEARSEREQERTAEITVRKRLDF